MLPIRKIVNQAAVRDAFHSRGTRLPPGFIDEVEMAVAVILRRAAAGDIEPEIKVAGALAEQRPLNPGTLSRIQAARQKYLEGQEAYLKQSLLKEALREALGKDRIETAWVAHVNAMVGLKVTEAAVRTSARGMGSSQGVPSGVLRTFLRSPERQDMTVGDFCRRWQEPTFRASWTAKAGTK